MNLQMLSKIEYNDSEWKQCSYEFPAFNSINIFRRTTPVSSNPRDLNPRYTNSHAQVVVCVSFSEGSMLRLSGRDWSLNPGEALVVLPWQAHYRVARRNRSGEWLMIRFSCTSIQSLEIFRNAKITLTPRAEEALQRLLDAWLGENSEARKYKVGAALAVLMGELRDGVEVTEDNDLIGGGAGNKYVSDLLQKLSIRYFDKKAFDEIAAKWSVTPEYLKHVFKMQIGCSFQQFINGRRIQIAKQMLRFSDFPVGKIAIEVGFQSVYAFSRFFKLQTDQTPNEYRKENSRHHSEQ